MITKHLKPYTIEVLTHTKLSGRCLDGSDAVYSKGISVYIDLLIHRKSEPGDAHLLRLAKAKRPDLMITKLLSKDVEIKL